MIIVYLGLILNVHIPNIRQKIFLLKSEASIYILIRYRDTFQMFLMCTSEVYSKCTYVPLIKEIKIKKVEVHMEDVHLDFLRILDWRNNSVHNGHNLF